MLEDNKNIYRDYAKIFIPDWETRDKNELVRQYCVETDEGMKNALFAAIMLKYWNKLNGYAYKCRVACTPEDVHEWIVNAIQYAIENQPWNNPDSSIYEDKNGPDKVINRFIESRRVTFYQQLNRYNRKINSGLSSLDTLTEEYKDVFIPQIYDDYRFIYEEIVLEYFNKKDYFMAFFIDAIIYEKSIMSDSFLDIKKLLSHLRHVDDRYYQIFADRYNFDADVVKNSTNYITRMTTADMTKKVKYNLIRLGRLLVKEDE